jgi:hypothetical protein
MPLPFSSRSRVRPTHGDLGSNNNNSNSGNQNAIVMGGTTVDTSANMFMAPGRDLIMNNYISMDQLSKSTNDCLLKMES